MTGLAVALSSLIMAFGSAKSVSKAAASEAKAPVVETVAASGVEDKVFADENGVMTSVEYLYENGAPSKEIVLYNSDKAVLKDVDSIDDSLKAFTNDSDVKHSMYTLNEEGKIDKIVNEFNGGGKAVYEFNISEDEKQAFGALSDSVVSKRSSYTSDGRLYAVKYNYNDSKATTINVDNFNSYKYVDTGLKEDVVLRTPLFNNNGEVIGYYTQFSGGSFQVVTMGVTEEAPAIYERVKVDASTPSVLPKNPVKASTSDLSSIPKELLSGQPTCGVIIPQPENTQKAGKNLCIGYPLEQPKPSKLPSKP